MLEAALRSGAAHRRSVFEVFARRLPEGRRYGVVCGTGRMLEALERFRFEDSELVALEESRVVHEDTLRWLAGYRFTGDVWGYGEGDCFFPGSPLLVVEGTLAEAVLLETLVLSILNHDCAVAAAASRMNAAARAAYVAGFARTSNLEAGRRYGVPTTGTSAHAFTLLHDDERQAFAAQVASLGKGTTLLVDTYDVPRAVRTAVEVAGPDLGAVRLDSGDLVAQAREVRQQLDDLGATKTKIIVTSDLDEYAIAALAAAPVDGYGVGTSLVTGAGAPTAGLVYKLVSRGSDDGTMVKVAKASKDKRSVGGRKWALRRRDEKGMAEAEVIGIAVCPTDDGDDRPLLVDLVKDGEVVGREPLSVARDRHAAALAELPPSALQLSRGEPAIPTVYEGED